MDDDDRDGWMLFNDTSAQFIPSSDLNNIRNVPSPKDYTNQRTINPRNIPYLKYKNSISLWLIPIDISFKINQFCRTELHLPGVDDSQSYNKLLTGYSTFISTNWFKFSIADILPRSLFPAGRHPDGFCKEKIINLSIVNWIHDDYYEINNSGAAYLKL